MSFPSEYLRTYRRKYYSLEYHIAVNRPVPRSIPALPALFGMLLLPFLLVSVSSAQSNSAASSGSHSASSAPATGSVAPHTGSVAPPTGAFAHSASTPSNWSAAQSPNSQSPNSWHSSGSWRNGNGNHHPHHTANGTAYYPYIYSVPVPYTIDVSDADSSNGDSDDADDAEYQGGPTIFDRRGSGPDSYVPPVYEGPAHGEAPENDPAESETPQPPTTLVFKDGHQVAVANYVIVSQTLYDLTPGHPRKIDLADLDLVATQRQNDDNGVVFQLPPSARAN
jgi:hypothetical protein